MVIKLRMLQRGKHFWTTFFLGKEEKTLSKAGDLGLYQDEYEFLCDILSWGIKVLNKKNRKKNEEQHKLEIENKVERI